MARAADVRAIAELSRDLIERGLGWTWHPARVLRSLRARETQVLVATENNCVIGFAVMEYGDTRAHLSLFGVHASHQRRGIGKRMLAWLEEHVTDEAVPARGKRAEKNLINPYDPLARFA